MTELEECIADVLNGYNAAANIAVLVEAVRKEERAKLAKFLEDGECPAEYATICEGACEACENINDCASCPYTDICELEAVVCIQEEELEDLRNELLLRSTSFSEKDKA
jgi:hypothetical protein